MSTPPISLTGPISLLRLAGAGFARRLAVVTPDQLCQPTPCQDWTVRDLLRHVVGESITSVRLVHGADALGSMAGLDGNILDNDPYTAFVTTAAAELSAFEESGSMQRTVHHPSMDVSGAELLGFRIGGLALHS